MFFLSAALAGSTEHATLQQVIAPYLPVFVVALVATLLLTPVMRRLALANGIVDQPDGARKVHQVPIAYMGGVAIFVGWLLGVLLSYFLTPHNAAFIGSQCAFPVSVVLGAAAIMLTGLFDDVYGISPRVKVGGQLFAAAALALDRVGLELVENSLRVMGVPVPATAFSFADPVWCVIYVIGVVALMLFVLGGCNALNLMDGLDGLAAGVTAIAAIGFLLVAGLVAVDAMDHGGDVHHLAILHGDPVRLIMCMAIFGAVLGFLPYNFNPANIFMGDAGSLLLGFLCVATMLLFSTSEKALLLVTACLIIFALPIADTMLAIVRRKMRRKPIFSPDKEHLHHLLRRSGLGVKQSVLIMYGLAGVFATLGVTMVALELRWRYLLLAFFVIYGALSIAALQYARHLARCEREAGAAGAPSHVGTTSASPTAATPLRQGS